MNIGDTIKVGRREHLIQSGDYIMYNGSCYMFCTGDRRTLYYSKNGRYNNNHTYDTLPKKLVKSLSKKIPGIHNLFERYENKTSPRSPVGYLFKAK